MRKIFFLIFLINLGACTQRPVVDLTLADVALKAAQKVRADSLAPDQYRQAENFYLRAKKDFAEGYYDSCKKFANEARLLAEQAEYRALLKQNQVKKPSSPAEEVRPPPGAQPYEGSYPGGPAYPGSEGPE